MSEQSSIRATFRSQKCSKFLLAVYFRKPSYSPCLILELIQGTRLIQGTSLLLSLPCPSIRTVNTFFILKKQASNEFKARRTVSCSYDYTVTKLYGSIHSSQNKCKYDPQILWKAHTYTNYQLPPVHNCWHLPYSREVIDKLGATVQKALPLIKTPISQRGICDGRFFFVNLWVKVFFPGAVSLFTFQQWRVHHSHTKSNLPYSGPTI